MLAFVKETYANGDLRRGHVGIWRFTADGRIEDLEAVPFAFD